MSYVLRASKYRHVFGEAKKPEQCFHQINSNSPTPEGFGLKGNSKFFGVSWKGGGGTLAVFPLDKPGRRANQHVPSIQGHTAPVLDFDFNPFDDYQVATASDDTTVKLWQIPEGGIEDPIKEPLVTLAGHQKKVHIVNYHPVADNIVASASHDHTMRVWDVTQGSHVCEFDQFEEHLWSISFNKQGSLCVTSCKDKNMRILDPRSGEATQTWNAHAGAKPQRSLWLGRKDKIATLGFSRQSHRQLTLWDPRNISEPIHNIDIDIASGMFMPMYDDDTGVLFLAGKGDTSIKYYEMADESPYMFYLSEFTSQKPQKGVCRLPKRAGDVMSCEIARVLRLTGDFIEVVSLKVPRKSQEFQEDIFPDTAAPVPALSAEQWVGGENADPKMMSLRPGADSGAEAAPRKTMKTAFQLQKEIEEKDKRIAELEKRVAELEGR